MLVILSEIGVGQNILPYLEILCLVQLSAVRMDDLSLWEKGQITRNKGSLKSIQIDGEGAGEGMEGLYVN